ncbi:MAG: hypothetical protein ACRED8_02015 [Caulobacteraceae bacterium]
MTSAWTDKDPVSSPSRAIAFWAGAVILLLALVGLGLGLRASWRSQAPPEINPGEAPAANVAVAKPIVELPPPVAAPIPTKADAKADQQAQAEDKALTAQTQAVQAIQAKPSRAMGNIDDILASPTEKPPPPIAEAPGEAPPAAPPPKTDVPF